MIMRTFGKLREILATNKELAKKLSQLESKYDQQFKAVFDAIREIMSHHSIPRKRIIGLNNQRGSPKNHLFSAKNQASVEKST